MKKFLLGAFAGVVLGSSVMVMAQAVKIFPDVPSNAYYTSAVGYMQNLGVMTGYTNGTFGPNDNVTRAQLATTLKRYDDTLSLLIKDYCQNHQLRVGAMPTTDLQALCEKRGQPIYANIGESQTPSQPVVCTMIAVAGLNINLKDEQGNPITGAKIIADGDNDTPFYVTKDGSYAGLTEASGHHIFVITKAGFQSYTGSVDLQKDECHVIAQTQDITLKK